MTVSIFTADPTPGWCAPRAETLSAGQAGAVVDLDVATGWLHPRRRVALCEASAHPAPDVDGRNDERPAVVLGGIDPALEARPKLAQVFAERRARRRRDHLV